MNNNNNNNNEFRPIIPASITTTTASDSAQADVDIDDIDDQNNNNNNNNVEDEEDDEDERDSGININVNTLEKNRNKKNNRLSSTPLYNKQDQQNFDSSSTLPKYKLINKNIVNSKDILISSSSNNSDGIVSGITIDKSTTDAIVSRRDNNNDKFKRKSCFFAF